MTIIQHKVIPDAQLHEPKGIVNSTGDKVYVSDGLGSGTWQKITNTQVNSGAATAGQVLRAGGTGTAAWAALTDADMDYSDKTKNVFGWNHIADSQYTSASPKTILSGVRTTLTINGLGLNTDQSRLGVIWSTTDNSFNINSLFSLFAVRLVFKSKTTAATGAPYSILTEYQSDLAAFIADAYSIPIKGGSYENRASNIQHMFWGNEINNNPLRIFVTPDTDITLYDIRILISRLYKES